MTPKAIIFDAYGTLFDVYSVTELAEKLFVGKGDALAQLWRLKQIEYTQLRTLSDPTGGKQYKPFSAITRDALKFSARRLGITLTPDAESKLMAAYDRLKIHPDVLPVLKSLHHLPDDIRPGLAILSNGDPEMLKTLLDSAGASQYFDHVLSVDTVKAYKPAPQVYALGTSTFGVDAKEIVFVSSNGWDAAGATWFGYTTFWVNRLQMPVEELDIMPHGIGSCMPDLGVFLEKRAQYSSIPLDYVSESDTDSKSDTP